jgi:hypothetical protein
MTHVSTSGERGLLEVAQYGKAVLAEYEQSPVDFKTPIALLVLLHIEQVLDSGRVLLDMPDPQIRSHINKDMDELRIGIVEIMKRLGKDEVVSLLAASGESFKRYFISAL